MKPVIPSHAKKVFQGKVFAVWQWPQKMYDGSIATFEALSRPDTATIIGVLPDKRILLAYDEQPHRPRVLTPPGGQIEAGEEPTAAAQRELREETGYEAKRIKPWYVYQPSAKVDWTVYGFVGQELTQKGAPTPEPGERITLMYFTFDEFLQLGLNPELRDQILRIHLLEALLVPEKKEMLRALLFD
jgi:ADP-ribose pyrophosphatase